jgi:tetratricopeptide (TPR) repeat protein
MVERVATLMRKHIIVSSPIHFVWSFVMRRSVDSWIQLIIRLCLVAGGLAATPLLAQAVRNSNSEVLTEEVMTRVLGFEKDDLQVPTGDDAAAQQVKKVRKLLADAVTAFRAGNGDLATSKFEEAKKEDATLPPANVLMARLCFAINDQKLVALGRSLLDRATDKNPEAPEPYLMLGQLALLEGRLTDAYVLFEKAGKLIDSPTAPQWTEAKRSIYRKNVFGGRVSVCEQRQSWEQGVHEIDGWIAQDPQDAVALFRKARLIFMKDPKDDSKVSEARKLFEEAYDSAVKKMKESDKLPAVPPAELALLELQTANGELEKAQDEIEKINAKTSTWEANKNEGSRVYSTVSQWYLGQGEFEKAEDFAAKATALDAESKALRQLTAVLHYYAGDPRALTEFTEMNQEQPDDFFSANFLALVLSDAKTTSGQADDVKRAKAVRIAEMSARLNPKSPVALATLAWVYFNAGRIGDAAQIFAALEQEPNMQVSPDTAYYMAKTFAALPSAQYPNALNRAKSLLELSVQSTGAFRYRAEAEKWLEALGGTVPAKNVRLSQAAPKEKKDTDAPASATKPEQTGVEEKK